MERVSRDNQEIDLPPGFRFHPTDEELITRYLSPKVLDNSFCAIAIGEVDLNKVEPWDLPWMAKMGEKEWYFFCVRDRKYPTGMRTNRATDAGYWKATGKDKEIFQAKALVGMKKTLVFYRGRAPKGEKTNWVMHEYRSEGKTSNRNTSSSIVAKNEWVICRIFKKSSGGKKVHISGLKRTGCDEDDLGTSKLPPLMDISCDQPQAGTRKRVVGEATSHVTCFSKAQVGDQKPQHATMQLNTTSPPHMAASSSSKNPDFCPPASLLFPRIPAPNSVLSAQIMPYMDNIQFQFPDSISLMQDHSILRLLLEENAPPQNTGKNVNAEFSQDTGMSTDMSSPVSHHEDWKPTYEDQEFRITSAGAVDLDYCLWNY